MVFANVAVSDLRDRFTSTTVMNTGVFRGWVCGPCNTRGDDIERLEKRVAFLKAHKKKVENISLIKRVHASRGH